MSPSLLHIARAIQWKIAMSVIDRMITPGGHWTVVLVTVLIFSLTTSGACA